MLVFNVPIEATEAEKVGASMAFDNPTHML
jgi:hypothetical protein